MGLGTCMPGASLKARAVSTMRAGGRWRFSYQVATAT